MKRFTMWTVLAAVALVIVVLTAGCTSNTGNTAQSPPPSAIASITPSAGGGGTTPSVSSMITYDSGNFTMLYPSDWKKLTNSSIAEIDSFYVYPMAASLSLHAMFLSDSNTTLLSWTSTFVEGIENYSNYTKISEGDTTLAGYPAHKIVYTNPSNNWTTTEIWTVKEGKVYTIIYSAYAKYYDAYSDTAQKMIDSFQIK